MADLRHKQDDLHFGCADDSPDRRRRRSDLDGDDLAESSAAVRRHSRILSRWITRQAEDMITTIERTNRETELMALARLHTVSMLDSSFLRESEPTAERRRLPPVSVRAASSVVERWRELERSRNEGGSESEDLDEEEEDRRSSPDAGEGDRERVRQIVRGISEGSRRLDRSEVESESPRGEWLGEGERERVRLVREWMQMASEQQREGRNGRRDGESVVEEGRHTRRRDLLRVRGRQARLDLIMRIVRERERELQGLSEHQAVSNFAHRNRIQV